MQIIFILLIFILSIAASPVHAESPLEKAIQDGNEELVREMIKSGVNPKGNSSREDPLLCAAKKGNVAITKLLAEAGATTDRTSPIIAAACYNKSAVGEYLLDNFKINVNQYTNANNTILEEVARCKNSHRIAMKLLDHGAYLKNRYGRYDVVGTAVDQKDSLMLRILVAYGGKGAANASIYGEPFFYRALQKMDDVKMVKVFIDSGFDMNNKPPIIRAAVQGALESKAGYNLEIIKVLVANGADIHAKDGDQMTPLLYAMSHKNAKSNKKLIDLLKSLEGRNR